MTADFAQSPFTVIGETTRACALTGDPLAADPGCALEPPATPAPVAISGASDAPSTVTAEQITDALKKILDPELGMSVIDLGLIYDIEVNAGAVAITMTLTAPGCPIHELMSGWVQQAAMKVPGVSRAEVTITFDPPWTPERITLPPGVAK
jgi:metal-sulfur cluster biosynthetic enzyme